MTARRIVRSDADYLKDELESRIGMTLTDVFVDPSRDELVMVFDHKGEEIVLRPQRDPEGNGPGWLDIYSPRNSM